MEEEEEVKEEEEEEEEEVEEEEEEEEEDEEEEEVKEDDLYNISDSSDKLSDQEEFEETMATQVKKVRITRQLKDHICCHYRSSVDCLNERGRISLVLNWTAILRQSLTTQ